MRERADNENKTRLDLIVCEEDSIRVEDVEHDCVG